KTPPLPPLKEAIANYLVFSYIFGLPSSELGLPCMQATFLFTLVFPPPTASSKIFAFSYRPGTRCTANARETFIVQSVVHNIIVFYVLLYVVQSPIKNWVEFQ